MSQSESIQPLWVTFVGATSHAPKCAEFGRTEHAQTVADSLEKYGESAF